MSKRGLDIGSLTPRERLDLLEELLDSFGAAPERIPLTEPRRAELDRRLDDLGVSVEAVPGAGATGEPCPAVP